MTEPTNQDTPVTWLRVEHNVVPGEASPVYASANPEVAESWAQSPFTVSVTPLYSSDQMDRMRERAERAEAERADEWRARREAEASRDTALAVAATFRAERDELKSELDVLKKAAEPFSDETIKTWVDGNGWTEAAPFRDRICDWFGPSDFRFLISALTKLQDTSHGHE